MPEGRQGPEGALGTGGPLAVVEAALAALEASRARIDDLNVYPVPDGDTGTNMALTVRAVRDALAEAEGGDVPARATRACLMGARGNSGVILSQLVRGAAERISGEAPPDAQGLAHALRGAADAGYAAVREPVEGTILTLARELAERAEALGPDTALGDALAELVAHGEGALARTREQLDVLREAGVVDAGAAGLLELVRGIAAHVRGEPLPEAPADAAPLPVEAVHRERSRYRYCTGFFVEGDEVEPGALERELGTFGDSLLVVGSRGAVKVHVHTDEPGRALTLATSVGAIAEVEIQDMYAQTDARERRLAGAEEDAEPAHCGVVAVALGAGNEALFREYGAGELVAGGQTMNPPTSELLGAVERLRAREAVLLPNNKNVVLAAEQAAAAAEKPVAVVPTTSMQAGFAALLAFANDRPAAENAEAMAEAAAAVRTGAVTRASRSAAVDGVRVDEGDFLGLVEGTAVAGGADFEEVARAVLERVLAEETAVLTLTAGEEAPDLDRLREHAAGGRPGLQVEVVQGGQPHYPLLVAAE